MLFFQSIYMLASCLQGITNLSWENEGACKARDLTPDERVMQKAKGTKKIIYLSVRIGNKKQEGKFCVVEFVSCFFS
jgi:hypothetical protein